MKFDTKNPDFQAFANVIFIFIFQLIIAAVILIPKLRERSFYVYLCRSICRLVGRSVKKMQKVQKKWGIQPMSANINCFNGGIDLRTFYI